jgi:putative transposase
VLPHEISKREAPRALNYSKLHLTPEQRREHDRLLEQRHLAPCLRDRLEMIRLSDAGWSVPRIASRLGQHDQTVRYWIKAFLTGGLEALGDKPHGGKVSQLTPDILAAVIQHLRTSPQTWTAAQIADWTAEHHPVRISPGRMRVHLRRAQLSYKRTSRSLKHKQKAEEVAAKEVCLETLKKGAMPG